jgi:ABC-type transport system involved in multi-copper enzyme maturation permease subunit
MSEIPPQDDESKKKKRRWRIIFGALFAVFIVIVLILVVPVLGLGTAFSGKISTGGTTLGGNYGIHQGFYQ